MEHPLLLEMEGFSRSSPINAVTRSLHESVTKENNSNFEKAGAR